MLAWKSEQQKIFKRKTENEYFQIFKEKSRVNVTLVGEKINWFRCFFLYLRAEKLHAQMISGNFSPQEKKCFSRETRVKSETQIYWEIIIIEGNRFLNLAIEKWLRWIHMLNVWFKSLNSVRVIILIIELFGNNL